MTGKRVVVWAFLLATGCGTAPSLPVVANWTRPLGVEGAVPVVSPWDLVVRRIFRRLMQVAAAEVAGRDVAVVVVDGPATLPMAASCGNDRMATILLSARALKASYSWPGPEMLIAKNIAHELAHVVLHLAHSDLECDWRQKEAEADALGIYYFERAGYDCQGWVAAIGTAHRGGYGTEDFQRWVAGEACRLAKLGLRLPPQAVELMF